MILASDPNRGLSRLLLTKGALGILQVFKATLGSFRTIDLFKYYFSFGVTGNCTTPSLWLSKANYPSQLELLARHFFPEGVKFPFYVPITKKRSRFLAENEELEIQLFSFHFLGVIFVIIDFISTASLSRQHDLSGFYFKPT